MITAAFLALLIVSAISVNRMLIESGETSYKTEAYSQAVGIAHELLTEITSKKYDEGATSGGAQTLSAFTLAPGGPGSDEVFSPLPDVSPYQSPTRYDDLDDYNGYTRTADGATISGFLVSASVYYVNTTSPHAAATGRTYMRRIDITVSHYLYLDPSSPFRISRFVSY
jgi:hypothetical protein